MGLLVTLAQHHVVLLPMRDTGAVVGLTTVMKQHPQSQMPPQEYAQYAMVLTV